MGRDGSRRVAGLAKLPQVAPQLAHVGVERVNLDPVRPAHVGLEVLTVRAHRVGREARDAGDVGHEVVDGVERLQGLIGPRVG